MFLERYNEKQARIAERRRINYEKKLVVSEKKKRIENLFFWSTLQCIEPDHLIFTPMIMQEGFKCHLEESCSEKFPSAADLSDHIKLHKEQMRKRLICTNDTSRTSICGKRCISRKEFKEHTEEHVAAFKTKTVSG